VDALLLGWLFGFDFGFLRAGKLVALPFHSISAIFIFVFKLYLVFSFLLNLRPPRGQACFNNCVWSIVLVGLRVEIC
jgi:hypothetical protein